MAQHESSAELSTAKTSRRLAGVRGEGPTELEERDRERRTPAATFDPKDAEKPFLLSLQRLRYVSMRHNDLASIPHTESQILKTYPDRLKSGTSLLRRNPSSSALHAAGDVTWCIVVQLVTASRPDCGYVVDHG